MINRVYKAIPHTTGAINYVDKGTEVAPIKYGTFHYAAYAGSATAFGKGGAFSSYIEFEYFADAGITFNKGDPLLYVQEWDTDTSFSAITPSREQNINVFYVTEIKEKRGTIYVLAYDCVEALLNVDFSSVLVENKASFPMTITSLMGLVESLTNVYAPWYDIVLSPPGRDNYWKQATVNYFYSPGITARDMLNWVSEIVGSSVVILYDGGPIPGAGSINRTETKTFSDAENEYWRSADEYIVCPDDGTYSVNGSTAINVWYKENGLEVFDTFTTYDGVEIISSGGVVLGSYYTSTPASHVLQIKGNLIAENINTFANIYYGGGDTGVVGTYDDLAEDILTRANTVAGMTSATIHLFPFRCPYSVGSRMYCVDTDGNQFVVPIMSIDITENEVVIGSLRPGVGKDDGNDVGESVGNDLLIQINQLKSMVNPLRTDTITATTNAYGNIFTTLDENCTILSAIRTGNTASICTPFWNESTGVWGIHVAGMSGAAVTSTSVTVTIVYLQSGAAGTLYYLVDSNGNYLTDSDGNRLTVTA